MKKLLLGLVLILLPTIVFGQNWKGQQFVYNPYTFATLPSASTVGSTLYCSDCQATNPASGSGTGAYCVATSISTWNCTNAINNVAGGSFSSYVGAVNITGSQTNGLDSITSINVNGAINIKTYGAKGNGLTDDTSAIQNALNAGTNILIPEGTYIISTALTPLSNSTITCANRYTTTLKANASNTTFNLINIFSKNNIIVQNCGFNPQYPGWINNITHLGDAIDVQDSNHITIRRNFFNQCNDCVSSYGSTTVGNTNSDLVVTDNEAVFTTPAFSFIRIIGEDGAIISRNKAWDTTTHSDTVTNNVDNGLDIYYNPPGNGGTGPSSICRGINIVNNEFYNFQGNNLKTITTFCPGTIIQGNIIVDPSYLNAAGTNCSFHDNISLQITGAGTTNPGYSDSVVNGNYSEGGDGINLVNNLTAGLIQNVHITNNSVKNAGCQAISISGSSGTSGQTVQNVSIVGNIIDTVNDFDITQTAGIGIFITGNQTNKNFDVSHNKILNTQKDSIWLRNPVSGAILQGNVIINPGIRSGYGNGIDGSSATTANSDLVILGNIVYNVIGGMIGIENSTSTGSTIIGNSVNSISPGTYGYHISLNGTALFVNNQCDFNSGTCFANSGTLVNGTVDASGNAYFGTVNATSNVSASGNGIFSVVNATPAATSQTGTAGTAICSESMQGTLKIVTCYLNGYKETGTAQGFIFPTSFSTIPVLQMSGGSCGTYNPTTSATVLTLPANSAMVAETCDIVAIGQ